MSIPHRLAVALLALATQLHAPMASAATDVAVLLPEKGRLMRVGQTVRDGVLAAYYQDTASLSDRVRLRFYDSSEADINTLLKNAISNGADAVIGPLDRDQVQLLASNRSAPAIPVIALNRADGGRADLYQLSLTPDDEIASLVDWMRGLGVQRPLMLVAQGDDAGQRLARLFEQAWRSQATGAPGQLTLDGAIKGGVVAGIRPVATQPGRHDALFLASPALARQVLPALTYFNSRLRLYSLSQAWEPDGDPSGQRDLDGLRFCGLPWTLEAVRPEQQALYDAQPRPDASHDRLYALGADAWSVLGALRQLYDGEVLSLRTGLVHLNDLGQLVRHLSCAEVRHGTATVMHAPDRTSMR